MSQEPSHLAQQRCSRPCEGMLLRMAHKSASIFEVQLACCNQPEVQLAFQKAATAFHQGKRRTATPCWSGRCSC